MQQPQPANRVISSEGLPSKYVEVWHSSDQGDLRELEFELPKGTRSELVQQAFSRFGRLWIDDLDKRGLIVNQKSIKCHGPFECLELSMLDMNKYVIELRCSQRYGTQMKHEEAERYIGVEPQPLTLAEMYAQSGKDPSLVEINARQQQLAKERTPEVLERRKQQDLDRQRLDKSPKE
jgi:hypothetical protein